MGISRNNGEGYPDPTAHIAVRNVEADAKKLKINYPTGYIELNLERFFPCPQSKAKKVFRLIHRYCTQTDKTRLLEFMTRRVACYDSREANSMKKPHLTNTPTSTNIILPRQRRRPVSVRCSSGILTTSRRDWNENKYR